MYQFGSQNATATGDVDGAIGCGGNLAGKCIEYLRESVLNHTSELSGTTPSCKLPPVTDEEQKRIEDACGDIRQRFSLIRKSRPIPDFRHVGRQSSTGDTRRQERFSFVLLRPTLWSQSTERLPLSSDRYINIPLREPGLPQRLGLRLERYSIGDLCCCCCIPGRQCSTERCLICVHDAQ